MMRRAARWIGGFVAWLAFAGVAFGGYDARVAELRDQLAQQVPDLAERAYLSKAVEDYIAARNQALADLVHIVEDDSTSNNAQAQRWTDRVASARGDLGRTIGDSLKAEAVPTVQALAFRGTVSDAEDKFLRGLNEPPAANAAAARDFTVDNHQKLVEFTNNLDEKWRAIQEQDKSIDEQEQQVVDELKSILNDAIAELARERRDFAEKLAGVVQTASKAPTPDSAPQWVDPLKDLIGAAADKWLEWYGREGSLQERYKNLVQSETGGIYVLFSQTRDDTQHFIDQNGFDKVKQRFQSVDDALRSWQSSLSTSGQKSDADAFSRDVLDKLRRHVDGSEHVFNDFVGKNQAKFFGPVGPDVKDALVEQRMWIDRVRMLDGLDLESRLREWRSDTDAWWNVDMSGIPSSHRDEIKRQLGDRVRQLVDADEKVRAQVRAMLADFDRSALGDKIR